MLVDRRSRLLPCDFSFLITRSTTAMSRSSISSSSSARRMALAGLWSGSSRTRVSKYCRSALPSSTTGWNTSWKRFSRTRDVKALASITVFSSTVWKAVLPF